MVSEFPVFLGDALRFGLASLILLPMLVANERRLPRVNAKEGGTLFLQAFTGVFGFSVSLLFGLKLTGAAESGIVTSTTPVVIALLSLLIFRETLTHVKWLGIGLTVLGMAVIQFSPATGESESGNEQWLGPLLVFGAVIGEALFSILGKSLSKRLTPLAIATYVIVLGFFMFLPFALGEGVHFDFSSVSLAGWAVMGYYAVVVTVIGFLLWYSGLAQVPASTVAGFTGLVPITALLFSYWLLDEAFAWSHLLGMGFVLGGIWLTAKGENEEMPAKVNIPADQTGI